MIILIILILRTTGLRSEKRAVILRMFLLKLVLNILQGAPAVEQSLRRHCFLQCKRQYCRSCFPEKLALRKGYRVLVSKSRNFRRGGETMLRCCSVNFLPETKFVLPAKGNLYRCFEYGVCPRCGTPVSRIIRQDARYNLTAFQRSGIKAVRELSKAKSERQRANNVLMTGSYSNQHYCYGTFRISRKKDHRGNTVYIQQKCNFNNQVLDLNEVETRYYSLF